MANITLVEVLAQANSLSPEERRLLADELLRDLKVDDAPRRSVTEFFGKLGPVPDDIDARLRALRDEWDDR